MDRIEFFNLYEVDPEAAVQEVLKRVSEDPDVLYGIAVLDQLPASDAETVAQTFPFGTRTLLWTLGIIEEHRVGEDEKDLDVEITALGFGVISAARMQLGELGPSDQLPQEERQFQELLR